MKLEHLLSTPVSSFILKVILMKCSLTKVTVQVALEGVLLVTV